MSYSSSESYVVISLASKLVVIESKSGKIVRENLISENLGGDPWPVSCSAISRTSKYLAGTSHKTLSIWRTDDGSALRNWELRRAPSSIAFSPAEDLVVVADKSGEVYLYGVENDEPKGEFLLGHISMLLDVLISKDGQFIITCDRDDKIRISRFPNAYNIHGFCLGHEECVTSIDFLGHDPGILVSASVDGTLRFWDFKACTSVFRVEASKRNPLTLVRSSKIDPCTSWVCHLTEGVKEVAVYLTSSCDDGRLTVEPKHKIVTDAVPRSIALTPGSLWILQENLDEPVVCYDCTQLLESQVRLGKMMSSVNITLSQSKELLEKTFKNEKQVDILFKRKYDELQAYLNTKLKRVKTSDKKT